METVAFYWDNFGPLHVDRCEAVQSGLSGLNVIGLERVPVSETYLWRSTESRFRKVTLFENEVKGWIGSLRECIALVQAVFRFRVSHIFLCHYERAGVWGAAVILRLMGRNVFTMIDSKFDDVPRVLLREIGKSIFLAPYKGCLAGSARTRDYMIFLGMDPRSIRLGYDSVSVARMRAGRGSEGPPTLESFASRDFVVVARLVEKKSVETALQAFAIYADAVENPRKLIVCGHGELLEKLRSLSVALGIADLVLFRGFVQSGQVTDILLRAIALLLPSNQEQFGQVVPEALALGVPALVSTVCGARDEHIRSGVNGFIFEPGNAVGLAAIMRLIHERSDIWHPMATAAYAGASSGDVEQFVFGVRELLERRDNPAH